MRCSLTRHRWNDKLISNNWRERMTSGGSSTECSAGVPQRLRCSGPAAHVGRATLTLPRGGLGWTVVPGAPGPEEVVGSKRGRRQPGQQVARVPIPAAATAHGDPEGHVRAEACGPAAGARRLLRPPVRVRLGHLAVHGAGAGRAGGGRAGLLRRGDGTGALE